MPEFIRHGSLQFRRANRALFAAGFATFGLLYCIQPLLPEFSRDFGVGAAQSALALSSTSAVLALCLLFAGGLSDRWGRKRIMTTSLFTSALLVVLTAFAPGWHSFLVLRGLLGLALSGVPAVAMTYLSEELHGESIGLGMGLFIGGSAAGGMGGRLITSALAGVFGWRAGIAVMGACGLLAAWIFAGSLPASRHFIAQPLGLRVLARRFAGLFRDPGLPWLFATGFVLLGAFVTLYNYIGYRLRAPPYDLSPGVVGFIFSVYLVGTVSSTLVGHVAGRLGRRKVLWTMMVISLLGLALTLLSSLWLIVLGVAVVTFGFFGGHSIASSWVGRRGGSAKAQAASLYLFSYYLGASVAGTAGGFFYAAHGWPGVAAFMGLLLGIGLLCAIRLYHLQPLARPQSPAEEPALP